MLIGEPDENPIVEATRRIGRLVEIVDGIAAAAELEGRAQKAATEVAEVGKLTVQEGNPGDDAVNGWIAAMLGIYRPRSLARSRQPPSGRPVARIKGKQRVRSFVSSKPLASR